MQDVTPVFSQAIADDRLWSVSLFFDLIAELKEAEFEVSYWEGEENWATIVFRNEPVAYVWRQYPLVIFCKRIKPWLLRIKSFQSLHHIEVRELANPELTFTYGLFKDYLDYLPNPQAFSAEDLWFYTNSI